MLTKIKLIFAAISSIAVAVFYAFWQSEKAKRANDRANAQEAAREAENAAQNAGYIGLQREQDALKDNEKNIADRTFFNKR